MCVEIVMVIKQKLLFGGGACKTSENWAIFPNTKCPPLPGAGMPMTGRQVTIESEEASLRWEQSQLDVSEP